MATGGDWFAKPRSGRSRHNVKRQHAGINQRVREERKVRRISFEDKRNESHFFFLPLQHTYPRISRLRGHRVTPDGNTQTFLSEETSE